MWWRSWAFFQPSPTPVTKSTFGEVIALAGDDAEGVGVEPSVNRRIRELARCQTVRPDVALDGVDLGVTLEKPRTHARVAHRVGVGGQVDDRGGGEGQPGAGGAAVRWSNGLKLLPVM